MPEIFLIYLQGFVRHSLHNHAPLTSTLFVSDFLARPKFMQWRGKLNNVGHGLPLGSSDVGREMLLPPVATGSRSHDKRPVGSPDPDVTASEMVDLQDFDVFGHKNSTDVPDVPSHLRVPSLRVLNLTRSV